MGFGLMHDRQEVALRYHLTKATQILAILFYLYYVSCFITTHVHVHVLYEEHLPRLEEVYKTFWKATMSLLEVRVCGVEPCNGVDRVRHRPPFQATEQDDAGHNAQLFRVAELLDALHLGEGMLIQIIRHACRRRALIR